MSSVDHCERLRSQLNVSVCGDRFDLRPGDIASHSIPLQLVAEEGPPTNKAHLDPTVDDVDVAMQRAMALGAPHFRENRTCPVGSPGPYLEWAVIRDFVSNAFWPTEDLA